MGLDELIHGAQLQVALAALEVLLEGVGVLLSLVGLVVLGEPESLVDHVRYDLEGGLIEVGVFLLRDKRLCFVPGWTLRGNAQ
ncbi:MAG: hypothetical protein ACMG6E_08545, partial [Candidatus Roizmanbacteria bacterium]